MGDEILAAQDGVVFTIGEMWPDDDPTSGHENRVLIRQADGTMAFYAHFQQSSIPVNAGDSVTTGQLIGRCGSSGTPSHPHLHFEVFESAAYDWDRGVPVSFRNAEGRLDSRGGLRVNETYQARPCN
jgi:murein DD-endopeptidase MepM/ murein hydrolase activator NlpD